MQQHLQWCSSSSSSSAVACGQDSGAVQLVLDGCCQGVKTPVVPSHLPYKQLYSVAYLGFGPSLQYRTYGYVRYGTYGTSYGTRTACCPASVHPSIASESHYLSSRQQIRFSVMTFQAAKIHLAGLMPPPPHCRALIHPHALPTASTGVMG